LSSPFISDKFVYSDFIEIIGVRKYSEYPIFWIKALYFNAGLFIRQLKGLHCSPIHLIREVYFRKGKGKGKGKGKERGEKKGGGKGIELSSFCSGTQ
jgi:hypothetical protein